MAKTSMQQHKLLRLRQIFLEETDEQNGLTMEELLERLAAFGITAERKSIYDNIDVLNSCGLDIIRERRQGKTYYFNTARDFEEAELRLLADAVASSRFITAKKSDQLLKKLSALAGKRQGAELMRQVLVPSRIKNMNETIFYLVDELNNAICRNSAVQFRYYDWIYEGGLRRKARHGGALYEVSPLQLLWEDEFYYLIAFDHQSASIRHYRVDRMGEISLTEQPRQGLELLKKPDLENYTARLFGMFSGEAQRITIAFPERLLDIMIDRFGKELRPEKSARAGRLQIRVDAIPSLPFFGWLLSLGEEVTLEAPETLRAEFRNLLETILKEYQ